MKNRNSIVFFCIAIHAPLSAMLSNVRTALGALRTVQHNNRAIRSFATEDTNLLLNNFLKQGVSRKIPFENIEHAEKFKLMLQTHKPHHSDVSRLLEDAASYDLLACTNILLEYCKSQAIDLHARDCRALHNAQSASIAQRLLNAGMNIHGGFGHWNTEFYTTPLHETPDHMIPFFLERGANAMQEDRSYHWGESAICRHYLSKKENPETTGWHKPLWISPERGPVSWEVGNMSSAELMAELANSFSEKELFEGVRTFCDIYFPDGEQCRGQFYNEYRLQLTPVARALRDGNIKRLQLFLKHAKSDAIILQLPKLTFLSKFLPAFFPSRTTNYNDAALLLADYEHAMASRIQEMLFPKPNKGKRTHGEWILTVYQLKKSLAAITELKKRIEKQYATSEADRQKQQ